ncbi:TadE/TadG family type IV pilus assembly protein [Aliamphritea ceti]|uniref:TadE/TadG family type IV pilus assembly protein n=1 Tax=Aliamphritea ceti TaxID=1524258 RepID=UPI0021C2AA4F|nr:TadE/TadG family type IV pilus assembly protein [Aliamphritea ceti]
MNTCFSRRSLARNRQQGVAAVEFTLALPLLLLLMFISAEAGRFLYQYNTLTKAVEGGARYLASQVRAVDTPGQLATVKTNAENLVRYGSLTILPSTKPLLPGPNVVAVVTDTAAVGANPIIVSATYTYDPIIFPLSFWQSIDLEIPMNAAVGMPVL